MAAGTSSGAIPARDTAAKRASAPVAVVELFTSEACPSCPAAEAFFKELVQDARRTGKPIFALSFHVDYWNPEGRKDPLSSDVFAQRQRAYVAAMNLEGAYTPQIIVNGTKEFIGSEREKGRGAIAGALSKPSQIGLKLRADSDDRRGRVQVDFEASALPRSAVVNVAVVERGLSKLVRTGGRSQRRQYENVVRAFRTVPLAQQRQRVELALPPEAISANASVIAFVQDSTSGAVLGASAVDLEQPARLHQAMLDEDMQ